MDRRSPTSLYLGLDPVATTSLPSLPPVGDAFSVNVDPYGIRSAIPGGTLGKIADNLDAASLGVLWKNFDLSPARLGLGPSATQSAWASIVASERISGGAALPSLAERLRPDLDFAASSFGGAAMPSRGDRWPHGKAGRVRPRPTASVAVVASAVEVIEPSPADPVITEIRAVVAEIRAMRQEGSQGAAVDRRLVNLGLALGTLGFLGYDRVVYLLTLAADGSLDALDAILRALPH